ncbi:hypothetical protein DL768_010769 [Monosporascus sp. mg162]|nr:hypothetical protein DL768_010769 [Monosporascus sp. mg162]
MIQHEVAIIEDLQPFEVSAEVADDFKRQLGDKVGVTVVDRQMYARLRAGATVRVPKATKLRYAAGAQLARRWDARVYGISESIISQVAPVSLRLCHLTEDALLDPIATGKAKGCLVGGFDSQELDIDMEILNMQANIDSNKDAAAGQEPRQINFFTKETVDARKTVLSSVEPLIDGLSEIDLQGPFTGAEPTADSWSARAS